MFKRKQGAGLGQCIDVVRQADTIKDSQPLARPDQKPQSQPGKAKLRERAHHNKVVVLWQKISVRMTAEGMIGLIYHNQTIGCRDDGLDRLRFYHSAGWIVGVGKKHTTGLMCFDSLEQRF